MLILLIGGAAGFFAFGMYCLACAAIDVPTRKTSKMMLSSVRQMGKQKENLLEVYAVHIARKLSVVIKLDPLRKSKIQTALTIAGVELTPEEYFAKPFILAGTITILGACFSPLSPMTLPIFLAIAVVQWFATYYSAFDTVKKRQKLLEAEIPRFALSVAQALKNTRDVIQIMTSYRRVAGPEFGKELDQTIADLKTGNYETAILNFETRIGSSLLSEVTRGLIGTLRGDDQSVYFEMICHDMRKIEQNRLEKEAEKQPPKIRKYSMMMLVCIIIIYGVVLLTEVISSMGVFFT